MERGRYTITRQSPGRLVKIIEAQTDIAKSDLDPDCLMALVSERACDITRADGALIEIVENDELVYRATTGEATPYLGLRVPLAGTLASASVKAEGVMRSDDTEEDPLVNVAAARKIQARSMIVVPLEHGGLPIGVLKVYSHQPGHFSDVDEETLEMLSDLISAQLTHATRFELAEHQSMHDSLTGLLNRRAYEERLGVEGSRSERHEQVLSLALFDLDGFKTVNDRLGHVAGDDVLRGVGKVFSSSRLSDDSFRIGGDEFAVLMPQTSAERARTAAARLAGQISEAKLCEDLVCASFGVAETFVGDVGALHAAADEELLRTKGERDPFAGVA